MNLIENLKSAFSSVYGHKMRSALTMLGIIIGISSVIMITSVGDGVKNTVFDTIGTINKNMIQVYPWSVGSMEDYINADDVKALKEIQMIDRITASVQWWGLDIEKRDGSLKNGMLLGTDESYDVMEKVEISIGRFITAEDVENRSRVAVINAETAFEVFGRVNCIGEKITIESWYGKEEYQVVGILKSADDGNAVSSMISTPLMRSIAVLPYTTLNDMFGYADYIDFLGVTLQDGYAASEASSVITRLLDIRHGTEENYYAESMEVQFDQIEGILSAITGFVAFVAAISLFVGGVGVMNIMLVTVKERTREIGIRKSLGATNGTIRFQFVMEAVILCFLGGFIGILLGRLFASGVGVLLSGAMGTAVAPVISPANVIIAFGVSSLVGIVFGVYPAGKAAKLDPIEALRYE